MAALDDISEGGGFSDMQRPLQVSPPAVDASLQGAPNSVGSRVALQPSKTEQPTSIPQPRAQEQAPGTDASALVGKQSDEGDGALKDQDEAVMGYDQQIAALNAAKEASRAPETKEERRKRERREKSGKIIAATVDGLSALSNLFFTSQYAPSSYNAQSSQLGKVNERIAALRAERQADADRYNNLMIRIGDAQNARANTLRDLRAQHEAQKMAREKAQRDAEEHGWLAALQADKQREQRGKADRAGYEAVSAQAQADNAPAMEKAKLETEQARRGSYEASASASRASAANSMASARAHDRSKVQVVHHFNGKTYPKGSNDYEKDVREAARLYNERHQDDDGFIPIEIDRKAGRMNVSRRAEEYAGEVETRLAEERENNDTPPSRRGNKDNTPPSRR